MFYQTIRKAVLVDPKRLASGLRDIQPWWIITMWGCCECLTHVSSIPEMLDAIGQTLGWMHAHGASWETAMATAVFSFALAIVVAGKIGVAATVTALASRLQ